MRDIPFIERIATRVLVLQGDDGTRRAVTLEIGSPVSVPQYDIPAACPYRLVGLDKEERLYAVGVDSVQALQLALDGIPPWLEVTGRSYGGQFLLGGDSGTGMADRQYVPPTRGG